MGQLLDVNARPTDSNRRASCRSYLGIAVTCVNDPSRDGAVTLYGRDRPSLVAVLFVSAAAGNLYVESKITREQAKILAGRALSTPDQQNDRFKQPEIAPRTVASQRMGPHTSQAH